MKPDTQHNYNERMLRVLLHIQQHLDEALPLEELAGVAHFSPYHFHRIFRGMIGESVQKHVRRLRLERAAHRLKFTDQPVTRIAFDAGYETHESFTRAFRTMFDHSPSEFRKIHKAIPYTKVSSGVHYCADGQINNFEPGPTGDSSMKVNIERIEPMRVVFMRHVGPYDQVGNVWQKLYSWAAKRNLLGPNTSAIGVSYDDPDITPPERIRCDACLSVNASVEPEGEVAIQLIGGGEYATTTHVGPYDKLSDTYARLCGQWLPASGREIKSEPALEFFRNSPADTKPEELITDIYIPLESKK